MKKFICIVMAVCIMLLCTACSGVQNEARTELENMMNAFKSCDEAQINKYYNYDSLTSYLEEAEGELLSEAVLNTLSVMDYEIKSSDKISGTAVKFNVDITTVDFSAIMEDFMEKVTTLIASENYKKEIKNMQDEAYKALMAEQMISAIEENFDTRQTKSVEVTMIKGEGGWTLGGRADEFLGVLFENLNNAVESLV